MSSHAYPRLAGTLIPVFALRHEDDFGIGDTRAVREAISFHAEHKLGLLQVLPVNETGADNSPYNAISSVALDPLYLTLTPALVPGLTRDALEELFPESLKKELQSGPVQYHRVKLLKLEILSRAYIEFEAADLQEGTDDAYDFQAFVENNMGWLPGYTLFRTLLNEYGGNALWHDWAPEHQDLAKAETWLADCADKDELVRYRQFTAYVQWVAWKQWTEVRAWADRHGIRLIGDIPFGVSKYSADVWSERELFDLEWSGGAPPEPSLPRANLSAAGGRTGAFRFTAGTSTGRRISSGGSSASARRAGSSTAFASTMCSASSVFTAFRGNRSATPNSPLSP
jgi:4-alpha-glucanotransferase